MECGGKGGPTKREWFAGTVFGILHSFLVRFIYKIVPQPYMDEEFHINQVRTYCAGNFTTWNAKITTPPALYLLSVPFFCESERYFNSALLPLCFAGVCALRRKFGNVLERNFNRSIFTATIVLSLPVLLDTSILYYTDLLALTAVVWGFYFEHRPLCAALCFLIGVLTRQTNIVWAGMYCVLAWAKVFDSKRLVCSTAYVVLRHWAFIVLNCAFFLFVYINQGIVLGDKTAHVPVFHFPQLLYFLVFCAFSALPLFFYELYQKHFWLFVRRKSLILFELLAASALSVHFFSFAHPYLLADNRHFTFYLWRRILDRYWFCKFALTPSYVIAFFFVIYTMKNRLKFFAPLFFLAVSACVVPAPLLEFRYFVIPYVLWRISVFDTTRWLLYLEFFWSAIVNVISLFLFIYKPFVWPHDQTQSLQRFMW